MHQISMQMAEHGTAKLKALKHCNSHCFHHLTTEHPELLSLLGAKPPASKIPKKPNANVAIAKAETLNDAKACYNSSAAHLNEVFIQYNLHQASSANP